MKAFPIGPIVLRAAVSPADEERRAALIARYRAIRAELIQQLTDLESWLPRGDEEAHLWHAHPMPDGGFAFSIDGHHYTWDRPSEMVGTLKRRFAPDICTYQMFVDVGGEHFEVNDTNAVDLTRSPRFSLIPPARM